MKEGSDVGFIPSPTKLEILRQMDHLQISKYHSLKNSSLSSLGGVIHHVIIYCKKKLHFNQLWLHVLYCECKQNFIFILLCIQFYYYLLYANSFLKILALCYFVEFYYYRFLRFNFYLFLIIFYLYAILCLKHCMKTRIVSGNNTKIETLL